MTGECLSPDLSFAAFKQIADQISGSGLIPVTITIPLPEVSPADLYYLLRKAHGFLLESMEGVPRRAVRSIIGTGIAEMLILDEKNGVSDGPIEEIRRFMETHQLCGRAPAGFAGGLVGYCSYDMVSNLNDGYLDAGREEHCPIGKFVVANSGVVLDHVKQTCIIFASPKIGPGDDIRRIYDEAAAQIISQALQVLQVKAATTLDQPTVHHAEEILLTSPISKKAFESAVEKTLEHIRAGDIFQAVISRRFNAPYTGDPFRIYEEVRQLNPSPYLYFLEFGDETIIGSSPEMLVKVDGEDIFTVPIAGTRPRGADPIEDARLAEEMLADEKEKAEHLMLVDLARNDIGKVASFGSVRVSSFMEVEKFSHVQHLTSQVTGKLATGSDRFDVLGSCFPAGTVSGAPKLRAMQIIAGLEPHARGLYAGAVGYIGFDDRLEFAIAIRTAIIRDGVASFQTGAGIVADSNPEREYEETRQKAGAMLAALSRASAHEITSHDQKKAGGIT
ncbi:MAG: anthranilate synthase component I family protein [Methanospirillum sp.]|uniref:anthranilate synthase component I family protein n=1 Tax=Methanospirillum sp. TaxID=45200 RepID=UPI0023718B1F|nr:anthranilate synthase component I family protein [Methanospirillum sp.]MDD1727615.1 anthranilate synthase component I family protein [Methanospirillum sp.]